MKIFSIITVIVAIGGGIFFWKTINKTQQQPLSVEKETLPVATRYIAYAPHVLQKTTDKKRILYFYANWCPTCRPVDQELTQYTDRIPHDVIVIRVNYNDSDTDQEEKNLASIYGITYQHTFVQIDAQGAKVTLWNGGGLKELLANIK